MQLICASCNLIGQTPSADTRIIHEVSFHGSSWTAPHDPSQMHNLEHDQGEAFEPSGRVKSRRSRARCELRVSRQTLHLAKLFRYSARIRHLETQFKLLSTVVLNEDHKNETKRGWRESLTTPKRHRVETSKNASTKACEHKGLLVNSSVRPDTSRVAVRHSYNQEEQQQRRNTSKTATMEKGEQAFVGATRSIPRL